MQVNQEILTRLVLKSNSELIIRAIEISTGMWDKDNQPTHLTLKVQKSGFKPDDERLQLFNEGEGRHGVDCNLEVVAVDPYDMRNPFCVQLPNGSVKWVSQSQTYVQ
jgi:hypothetical protein